MADKKNGKKNGKRYYDGSKPEDADFLRKHFVEGTEWKIRMWGGSVGVATVKKDWVEVPGLSAVKALVRYRSGEDGDVFLAGMEARPVSDD